MPALAARTPRERSDARRRTARRGRHVRWTVLPGSRDSLIRQNAEIDRLQIPRIEDDEELQELVVREELVPIRNTQYVRVDPRLDPDRRYCREWVWDFLQDLGEAYYRKFGKPIQVNSAVRTVAQQKKLLRTNRNAAPVDGDTASSHLAGITVDLARKGMTRPQRNFVVKHLVGLKKLGLVEAVEERWQACFHVMVSDRYADWRSAQQLAGQEPARRQTDVGN
jgi:hypothetical protein